LGEIEFLSNQPKITVDKQFWFCGKAIAEPKELIGMVKTRKSELNGIQAE
jgi:hypothetical protein